MEPAISQIMNHSLAGAIVASLQLCLLQLQSVLDREGAQAALWTQPFNMSVTSIMIITAQIQLHAA